MPTSPLTVVMLPWPGLAARFLVEAWWTCVSSGLHTWRNRADALVSTGEALTVIAPTIKTNLNLDVRPVRGWRGQVPSWCGIPCRIGRVTLWLPCAETPGQLQSFDGLAIFPQADLPDAPPYILLGTQFFLEYRIIASVDGGQVSNSHLTIP